MYINIDFGDDSSLLDNYLILNYYRISVEIKPKDSFHFFRFFSAIVLSRLLIVGFRLT